MTAVSHNFKNLIMKKTTFFEKFAKRINSHPCGRVDCVPCLLLDCELQIPRIFYLHLKNKCSAHPHCGTSHHPLDRPPLSSRSATTSSLTAKALWTPSLTCFPHVLLYHQSPSHVFPAFTISHPSTDKPPFSGHSLSSGNYSLSPGQVPAKITSLASHHPILPPPLHFPCHHQEWYLQNTDLIGCTENKGQASPSGM